MNAPAWHRRPAGYKHPGGGGKSLYRLPPLLFDALCGNERACGFQALRRIVAGFLHL